MKRQLKFLNIAKEINPSDSSIYTQLGKAYFIKGDIEKAQIENDMAISRGSTTANLQIAILSLMTGENNKELIEENFKKFFLAFGRTDELNIGPLITAYFNAAKRNDYKNVLYCNPLNFLYIIDAFLVQDSEHLVKAFKNLGGSEFYFFPYLYKPPFRHMLNQQVVKDYITEIGLVDHWRDTEFPSFCRVFGENDFECRDRNGNWP